MISIWGQNIHIDVGLPWLFHQFVAVEFLIHHWTKLSIIEKATLYESDTIEAAMAMLFYWNNLTDQRSYANLSLSDADLWIDPVLQL